jgi:hypothetical protein
MYNWIRSIFNPAVVLEYYDPSNMYFFDLAFLHL